MLKIIQKLSKEESCLISAASANVEEVFTAIKTVMAFMGQTNEIERYDKKLREAKKVNVKKSIWSGFNVAVFRFLSFAPLLVQYWYCGKLLANGDNTRTLLRNILIVNISHCCPFHLSSLSF